MKLMNNNFLMTFKPLSLALLLAFSAANSLAAEMTDSESSMENSAPDIYDNDSWQSPIAIEFNKLDKSGNGLLLPNEASKGKAFNKKTFKQADTDNDGSIDINEYIFFKTSKMPEASKPVNATPPEDDMYDIFASPDAHVLQNAP